MDLICNICGNDAFGNGPSSRLSATGLPPRCTRCQSLERHRLIREVMLKLKDPDFSGFHALQFSEDRTIEPAWFAHFERSIYQGENSLDLQKIDKESQTYDLVICNHVLEHVPYDNSALNELVRIIKIDGYVFLTVPSPSTKKTTSDWGYPKPEQHGHYRIYGADITEKFARYIPHIWVLSVCAIDPITGTEDIIFFLCRTNLGVQRILSKYKVANVIQEGA